MKILIIILLIIFSGAGILFLINRQSNNPEVDESLNEIVQSDLSRSISTDCSRSPLIELTEGPYYKSDSPERQNITDENTSGEPLILEGYVLDTNCKPIPGAWLDFWQADGQGTYDNSGFKLRGHQYTDENGYYRLETVVPTRYTGRTEHIHFKVRRDENSPIITSQLFFPGSETNSSDSIFDESLIINLETDPDGSRYAGYTIIIP